MAKLRRLYFRKSEITHPDNLVRKFALIDLEMEYIGEKKFDNIILEIKSKKTGNTSRLLQANPVEIQSLSGIHRMVWTDKMIRKRERVFNFETGQEYKVKPIARVWHLGYIIYDITSI